MFYIITYILNNTYISPALFFQSLDSFLITAPLMDDMLFDFVHNKVCGKTTNLKKKH